MHMCHLPRGKVHRKLFPDLKKKCYTEHETKIQEALLIKKLNPKLNKQLYAKDAFFC